jgi:hypothetical protein
MSLLMLSGLFSLVSAAIVMLLLCSIPKRAAAQNLTSLSRSGITAVLQRQFSSVTEAEDWQSLKGKLPQVTEGSAAESQLRLLSPSSRNKLNSLTGVQLKVCVCKLSCVDCVCVCVCVHINIAGGCLTLQTV